VLCLHTGAPVLQRSTVRRDSFLPGEAPIDTRFLGACQGVFSVTFRTKIKMVLEYGQDVYADGLGLLLTFPVDRAGGLL
jgi:hypothetical protein